MDCRTDAALLLAVETPAVSSRTAAPTRADTVVQCSLAHRLVALWLYALTLVVTVAVAPAQAATQSDRVARRSAGVPPRIAMVIGNSEYESLPRLETPANDAKDVGAALKDLGFKVTTLLEASLEAMRDKLLDFSTELKTDRYRNALAVFYFAGHGLRDSDGQNYMLPVEFDVDAGREKLRERAIWLHREIIKAMTDRRTGGSGSNVIILDASREDEIERLDGLWQVDPRRIPPGTLIAFAAAPGQASVKRIDLIAPERNSIYTKHLVQQLEKIGPNIDLEGFFAGVRNQVVEASDDKQTPRFMANLAANRIFLAAGITKTLTSEDEKGELELWDWLKDSPARCDFEEYLERYPDSEFAALAGDKLRKISQRQAAEELIAPQLPETLRQKFRLKWAESDEWCRIKSSKQVPALEAFLENHPNSAHARQAHTLLKRLQNSGARGPRERRKNAYVRQPARAQACQDLQRANRFNALWRFPGAYPSGKRCLQAGERTAKRYQQAQCSRKLTAPEARRGYGLRAAAHRQGIGDDYPDWLSGYPGRRIAGARSMRVRQRDEGPLPRRTPIAQTDSPATQYRLKVRSTRLPVDRPDGLGEEVGDDRFQEDVVKAEQGNVDAMYRLALAYEKGTPSVRRDTDEMLRWLLLSSAMGNGVASYKLARYYSGEEGGYFKAVKFRSLAKNQGYTPPVGLREER